MIKIKKETLLTSIGAGLEYYDFVVYGMLAGYLSQLFFPETTYLMGLLQSFSVFFLGYIVRPIGGVIVALYGDKHGRKGTFLAVMLMMAISTFLIGCLPTYQQIGIFAPIFLLILRVIQGLSYGAELPNAMTVACEFADRKERGFQSSFVISSVSLGAMLASLVSFLIAKYFIEAEILNGVWRLPFLFGGVLAIISYVIRRRISETPEFEYDVLTPANKSIAMSKFSYPLLTLLTSYKGKLLQATGILVVMASLVLGVIFFINYVPAAYGFERSDVYFASMVSLIWGAFLLPIMGKLSDLLGRKKLMLVFLGFMILGFKPLFLFLETSTQQGLMIFFIAYQTLIAGLFVNYFALLSEIFPTRIRFTAIALSYNLVYSIAGLVPALLTYLQTIHPGKDSIIQYYLFMSIVSTICVIFLKEKKVEGHSIYNQSRLKV